MRLFGHRFSIHPLFWVIWILGCVSMLKFNFRDKEEWILAGILLVIMVTSMIWHEFGHIFFHRIFGAKNLDTVFGAYGPRTDSDANLRRFQRIAVYLAGPIFSLVLAAVAFGYKSFGAPPETEIWQRSVDSVVKFNVLWAVLNLLPILPLDAGRLVTEFYPGTKKLLMILGILLAIAAIGFGLLSGRWVLAFLAIVVGYVNINLLFGREVR